MANLLWPLLGIVFLSSTFSGIFGMAGGMILISGLLFYYNPVEAIFLHGLIQFFANGQRFLQLRNFVEIRSLRNYAIGSGLAFVFLHYVQFRPSAKAMYWLMGVGALLAAFNVRAPFSLKNARVSLGAGFFVGAMQIAGVVGPMLDIISQDSRMSRHEAMGTKSGMVAVSHMLKVIFMGHLMGFQATKDIVNGFEIMLYLFMAYLGTRLGKVILDVMSDKAFYRCTSFILIFLSLFYVWKAIRVF